ncbi:MAG TPA: ATP-binding protein [Polyangiales bacterium]
MLEYDEPVFEASQLRATLDSLREGVQVLSPEWRYLYVNETAARQGRKTLQELFGHLMLECFPQIESTPMFQVLARCMRERRYEHFDYEWRYPDGARTWFQLRIEPCREGLVVLSLDITEHRQRHAAQRELHKLQALGRLAARVASDFEPVFEPLQAQLDLLAGKLSQDPSALDVLGRMRTLLEHGTETTERLRELGRQTPHPGADMANLSQLAHEAAELCRMRPSSSHAPVRIHEVFDTSLPLVHVSSPELLSALVNLMLNAGDALPRGGNITLRTGNTEQRVWVAVEDDGVGMTPEVEARAFEAFFTTKGEAGTGLGLAMVYALVSRHGGRVQLRTAPGQGTTITLSFPQARMTGG